MSLVLPLHLVSQQPAFHYLAARFAKNYCCVAGVDERTFPLANLSIAPFHLTYCGESSLNLLLQSVEYRSSRCSVEALC